MARATRIRANSPRATRVRARLAAPRGGRSLTRADAVAGDHGQDQGQRHGGQHRAGHGGDVARVDGQPEGEEEDGGEGVPQRQHQPLDPLGRAGLSAMTMPDHEGADGVGHPRPPRPRPAASSARPRKATVSSSSSLEPSSRPTSPPPQRAKAVRARRNSTALPNDQSAAHARGVAEQGLEGGQVEGQEHVLHHDDAEDQLGLGVGQPLQLDQQLGHDRRRRDAHDARHDQRLGPAPAQGQAEQRARRRR